jgi:hypothetical protein
MSRPGFLVKTNQGDMIFAAIPKCGQHTLIDLCVDYIDITKMPKVPKVAFIREPIDRLLSAYHFFHLKQYKLDGVRMGPYEAFVDWALTSNEEHIRPQVTFCKGYDHFVDLKSMSYLMSRLTDRPVDALNTATRYNDANTSYRRDEIESLYSDDFKKYRECVNGLSLFGFQ